ncbi:MAG: histidinol-phosphatase [Spirochaetaceae bacterium]|jgi:histidinol-phosphatase (PHP family)|nr:histidinol-phosphatase [Spirochaetaceae bacterium]
MQYSCLHTHTAYCDGKGSPDEFCAEAYKNGFVSIGFSAHAPISHKTGYSTEWHLQPGDFEKYCACIRETAKRWDGKLKVFLGLEVDYIKDTICAKDWDAEKNNLDYLIGSVHYLNATKCVDSDQAEFQELINNDFSGDVTAILDAYWDNVETMLQIGGIDIFAHPDIVKKNNKGNKYFNENDDHYKERVRRVADILADLKIVTEVNTGGMIRLHLAEPYPSRYFLGLLKKNNVPVMINSDAHCPEHLSGHYETARTLLQECGYTKIVYFQGRSCGKAIWKEGLL